MVDDSSLYLEVYFDDRPTGQIVHLRLIDGGLSGTPEDLRSIGLVVAPELPLDADGLLRLDALPGLRYRYDAEAQRLVLNVPVFLRPRQELGYRVPEPVEATRSQGVMLNYDAYARGIDGTNTLSVATMLRWFGGFGALELSQLSRAGSDPDAYQRLDTRWSYSDPTWMATWTAGDLISGGLSWTRSVRLGGLQWRRNFSVRPDLITFPVPRFSSQAVVPSAVELLVNNLQQFSGQVDDGPFVLDAFPRISGAGEATLVVRDALGRATLTSVPIYVDYLRLAPGLSDFSVEAGKLRRGYATDEDRYDHDIVASGSYRRGLSEVFTIESHGEYGPNLRVAGLGGIWSPAGRWGVGSASLMRSSGDASGSQRTYGYQWAGPQFGLDLHAQRRSEGFRDIGDLVDNGVEPARLRAQDRASLWAPLPRGGSLAYSWIRWRDSNGDGDRVHTLSWSQVLGRLYASASVFDGARSGRGFGLSLTLSLDHARNASLTINRGTGHTDIVAGLHQTPAYEGGWGWDLQAGDRGGSYGLASATVRGDHGEATFGADHVAGSSGYFAQASGSVVHMGGETFASRRISDSFAVVSSNHVADVPVSYENRVYGRTDGRGFLLLPDLRGWQRNRIAIDPDALGVDIRVPSLEQRVTPVNDGGVLVKFDLAKVHPAMITLLDRHGVPAPAGAQGRVAGSTQTFLVGLDGEAYLDDLKPGTVLKLEIDGVHCSYRVVPAAGADTADMDRIGPLRCEETP